MRSFFDQIVIVSQSCSSSLQLQRNDNAFLQLITALSSKYNKFLIRENICYKDYNYGHVNWVE